MNKYLLLLLNIVLISSFYLPNTTNLLKLKKNSNLILKSNLDKNQNNSINSINSNINRSKIIRIKFDNEIEKDYKLRLFIYKVNLYSMVLLLYTYTYYLYNQIINNR